ncbi:MAG: hypothetical protein HYS04_17730 [Acidobacteria bacterium]|nr:hypothetical protein [Acidobacteriota bacterium]
MGTAAPVSEQEYIESAWDPDREYDHGILTDRNLGTPEHGDLQGLMYEVPQGA